LFSFLCILVFKNEVFLNQGSKAILVWALPKPRQQSYLSLGFAQTKAAKLS